MDPIFGKIFGKLNLKDEHQILVVNAPPEIEPALATLDGVDIVRDADGVEAIAFALVFVTRQAEVDRLGAVIAPKAEGDAKLWFAYPKGTSKRYRCDVNRDTGWRVLGEHGFEPVRQVALDADWSALRFRHVQYIKSLKREAKRAISAAGKGRAGRASDDPDAAA